MPFGPVNDPVIFIIFIHDMNMSWQELAMKRGLKIGTEVGTKLIIDDIFSVERHHKPVGRQTASAIVG